MLFHICAALSLLAGLATAQPCDGTSQTITAHKFARYEAASGNFGGQPLGSFGRANEIECANLCHDRSDCVSFTFQSGTCTIYPYATARIAKGKQFVANPGACDEQFNRGVRYAEGGFHPPQSRRPPMRPGPAARFTIPDLPDEVVQTLMRGKLILDAIVYCGR
ncbi:hypothetical protein HD553DRAFT_321500 [Filobasidium floriforme]|uniref:uncharacterized protein n=1 Tax=Filobasidium floriforme TaxID=5210 RepID=UPI001E8CAF87|nr:uncharacterized protein HD553DRAFT_321500 [Filobasidium floriforme]KAH8090945.1 hypothetical protein HD553DRAFT_321500 [Filobasidium floriforme]